MTISARSFGGQKIGDSTYGPNIHTIAAETPAVDVAGPFSATSSANNIIVYDGKGNAIGYMAPILLNELNELRAFGCIGGVFGWFTISDKVKIDETDAQSKYLNDKILVGGLLVKSIEAVGGAGDSYEALRLNVTLYTDGTLSGAGTAASPLTNPSAGLVLSSADDAAPGTLATKLVAGNNMSFAEITKGGVKRLQINGPDVPIDAGLVHKASNETLTAGKAFAKGAIFYGQDTALPTTVGPYSTIYVHPTYGVRLVAYDGTAYQDFCVGAMPETGKFSVNFKAHGGVSFGYKINLGKYAAHPGKPLMGDMYYNTTDNNVYYYNSTAWISLGGGGSIVDNSTDTAYTFLASDANTCHIVNTSTSTTRTVPSDTTAPDIAIGDSIEVQNIGTGVVTFVAASGVTIRSSLTLVMYGQYSVCMLRKIAANTWILTGERTAV